MLLCMVLYTAYFISCTLCHILSLNIRVLVSFENFRMSVVIFVMCMTAASAAALRTCCMMYFSAQPAHWYGRVDAPGVTSGLANGCSPTNSLTSHESDYHPILQSNVPSQLGSQFPRGRLDTWPYGYAADAADAALSIHTSRSKAEGCRGLHILDGSRKDFHNFPRQ